MPSFFSKLFSPKKDKKGDSTIAAAEAAAIAEATGTQLPAATSGRTSPQPPGDRSGSAQPAGASGGERSASGPHPTAASDAQRSASVRSASPAPAVGSFAREDSATSHVTAGGPPPPPGTKILVPAPRGVKIVVPPRAGFPGPGGAPAPLHPPSTAPVVPAAAPQPAPTAGVIATSPSDAFPPQLNETVAEFPSTGATPQMIITPRDEVPVGSPGAVIVVSDSDSDDIMFEEGGADDNAEFMRTTDSVPQIEMPTWDSRKSTPQDTPIAPPIVEAVVTASTVMPRESSIQIAGASGSGHAADVAVLRSSGSLQNNASANNNSSSQIPSVYIQQQQQASPVSSKRGESSQPRAPSAKVNLDAVTSALSSRLERPAAPTQQQTKQKRTTATAAAGSSPTPFTATTTTSVDKQRVADLFFSILCPQQYFGKVLRVRDIRSVVSANGMSAGGQRGGASSPHKGQRSITVATKNGKHDMFYPLVRLDANDVGTASGSGSSLDDEEQRTAVTLFHASPGTMGFAEDIANAEELLRSAPDVYNSCYVLSHSGIMLTDAAKQVTPVATLTLCWAPYYSESANGACPLHSVPYELFDTSSRELLCALCLAKAPQERRNANVTVLSELMSEPVARRVFHTLNAKVQDSSRMIHKLVATHQKAVDSASRQCASIDRQFDMLAAALEAKRSELKEQARDEALGNAGQVAKDILSADEHVHIMRSAADHINKSDSLRPLQLGTIANAMAVAEQIDHGIRTGHSLNVGGSAAVTSGNVTLNLESAMHAVQRLYIDNSAALSATSSNVAAAPRAGSPMRGRQPYGGAVTPGRPSSTVRVVSPYRYHTNNGASGATTPRRTSRNSSPVRQNSQLQLGSSSVATPTRYVSPVAGRRLSGSALKDPSSGNMARRHSNPQLSNNLDASNIFSTPIHQLLSFEGAVVSWTLKIQDPGDWVGVGVGVGPIGAAWRNVTRPGEAASDLSHLWIVPSRAPRVVVLRVTLSNGIARLTVHDKTGKQLDDGRIAHWHAQRSCFPQVTFGGRVGSVALLREPRVAAATALL